MNKNIMNNNIVVSVDIENIFNLMKNKLHNDLIERIIRDAYRMHNITIIRIQKNLKNKLNLEFIIQNEVIFGNEYLKFLINML